MKPCKYCGIQIHEDAVKCKNCKRFLLEPLNLIPKDSMAHDMINYGFWAAIIVLGGIIIMSLYTAYLK